MCEGLDEGTRGRDLHLSALVLKSFLYPHLRASIFEAIEHLGSTHDDHQRQLLLLLHGQFNV